MAGAESYVERLIGGGFLIAFGLASDYLTKITKIPDVFFLILAGFFLGPLFGVVNPAYYTPLIHLVTAVALAFLMFWIGTTLRVKGLFTGVYTHLKFTILAYVLTLIVVFSLASFWGLPFYSALLIAILLSDSCPTVVNGVMKHLRLTNAGRASMIVESSVSNSISLALFLAIYPFANQQSFSFIPILSSLVQTFSVAMLFGVGFAAVFIYFLRKVRDETAFTWVSLAGLLVLFGLVEYLQASGPIAAFVFGLLIVNADLVEKHFKLKPQKLAFSFYLQDQVLFFIRTAFFLYMGLFIPKQFDYSIILFAAIAIALTGVVRTIILFAKPGFFSKKDKIAQTYIYPTGFSVVVLTLLPETLGFTVPHLFEAVLYAVILSNLLAALASYLHSSKGFVSYFNKNIHKS
ncbi:cation:proton antiporter [Candidatus Micrarchaeota archaeon]|nr:cation:proton antiporter [Candidatus Micrarchaeota archaeon]